MRPPEGVRKRLVREWLRKANADFDLAEHLVAEGSVFLNAIAFHCQQAVEKYLKALLTWWGTEFPKTHVLATLFSLIETRCRRATAEADRFRLQQAGVANEGIPRETVGQDHRRRTLS